MPYIFFFNDTATTEIYTLSLHDALPISSACLSSRVTLAPVKILMPRFSNALRARPAISASSTGRDRKSTRLNSSHQIISYAVFCLKKKKPGHVLSCTEHRMHCMHERHER